MTERKSEEARAFGSLFIDLLFSERKRIQAIAAELGLPLVHAGTLWRLGEHPDGLPMNALADHAGCDPSNVTGIADKLEARGLLRRVESSQDRRVKLIVLTSEGKRLAREMTERLLEPPEWVLTLPAADQKRLRSLLERGLRGESRHAEAAAPARPRARATR